MAHLHSPVKGANRTPLGACCLASCRQDGEQPVRPPQPAPNAAEAGRTGGLGIKRGTRIVATMSSAEPTRRDFLYIATAAIAAVGGAATLVPLITQMNPDASTIAAGAPVEIDLAPIAAGQIVKVFWRSKPIYISHRTQKEIDEARMVDLDTLKDPQKDEDRVK